MQEKKGKTGNKTGTKIDTLVAREEKKSTGLALSGCFLGVLFIFSFSPCFSEEKWGKGAFWLSFHNYWMANNATGTDLLFQCDDLFPFILLIGWYR